MRKFYLRNSIGEEIPLNGENGLFFANPQGLGYSMNPQFANLQNGFYESVYELDEPQGQIVGDLTFTRPDPYEKYFEFVNWLNKGFQIDFVYAPEETRYFKTIELGSIEKSELNRAKWLIAPVTFNALTPWFKPNPISIRIAPSSSERVKRYPYRYSYVYQQAIINSSAEVRSTGHMPSGIKLTIPGLLVNPKIRLERESTGEIIGEASLAGTISPEDVLEFSTLNNAAYILINGEDAVSFLDITQNAFFQIPQNQTCLLSIISDTTISTTALVSVYDYYRSV